jgi:hypothetical protein
MGQRRRVTDPFAPKKPHFNPKAKRVIFLFSPGGVSHVDTFDYKPKLVAADGKTTGAGGPISLEQRPLLKPRWQFKPGGKCGTMVSDIFPHLRDRPSRMSRLLICAILMRTSSPSRGNSFPRGSGARRVRKRTCAGSCRAGGRRRGRGYPDHWHALATIWACQAGKHVYVEKPASHNLIEGRRMVEAARKYNRVVQLGTQSRSSASLGRAVELVRSGKLGKIPFARAWVSGPRPNIGHEKDTAIPKGVDYSLWIGPAPERAFNPNRFHYRWHWMWDYGTGELGNNGIHALDRIRWLLKLEAPVRITAGGGKLFYDDDQETPDTLTVTYDFPTCSVTWEHRVWSREKPHEGLVLYGEHGTLVF